MRYSTRVPSQGWPCGRDRGGGVVREPHGPAVLVDRLDLGAAGVAVVAELAEQRVEVGRPGEQTCRLVRLRRSYSPLKAVSPPNEPRLSPATKSSGRWSGGQLRPRGRRRRRRAPGRPRGPWTGRPGRRSTTAGRSTGSRRSPRRRRSGTRRCRPAPGRPSRCRSWSRPAGSCAGSRPHARGPRRRGPPGPRRRGRRRGRRRPGSAPWPGGAVTSSMSPDDGPRPVKLRPCAAQGVPRHERAGAAGPQAGRGLVHALGASWCHAARRPVRRR